MISLFAKTPGTSDYWMLAGIGALLVVLVFLALAEMSMSQMTKPRAAALAEKGVKSGKALVRLADQPTMWVNPLLLTVNVCQTVQATLMGIVQLVSQSTLCCFLCWPKPFQRRTHCCIL
jgi:CBS domain containing-hemolysin-like protein